MYVLCLWRINVFINIFSAHHKKTQSEARLKSELLIVHVMAEVVCPSGVALHCLSSCGNPFQIHGTTTENRWSPNEVSVRGTVNNNRLDRSKGYNSRERESKSIIVVPMFHVPTKMEMRLTSGSRLCMFFSCCTSWQKFSRWRTSSNMYVFFLQPAIFMSSRQLFAVPLISCSTRSVHTRNHENTTAWSV